MKTINFPQPVHEQAVEILKKAQNELEALGYKAGFTASVESRNVLSFETQDPDGEKQTVNPHAFFQLSFVAGIEC